MKGDLKPPVETIEAVFDESPIVYLTMKYFVDDLTVSTYDECMNTEIHDKSHHDAYHIRLANYTPLIGGEKVFSVLEDALQGATKSIDYLCWGFQPSMYFKRTANALEFTDASQPKPEMIGTVLERIAARGVKIRILAWFQSTAQYAEPNLPGFPALNGEGIGLPIGYATLQQQEFDRTWHQRLNDGQMPNISLRTRGFSDAERHSIAAYLKTQSSDQGHIFARQFDMLTLFPTHHQKTVVIDYEAPEQAVGFIMGHNSTSQYWSAPPYSVQQYRAHTGRDGPIPYHDNSAMITGPLLYDLNHNFSQAWDKAAQGQPGHVESDLLQKRSHIKADHIPLASQAAIIQNGTAGRAYPVPAQICRTQPQHNVRNIETLYLQAVMQIGRVVYFENQYFRFAPLIATMKKNRIAYHEWGGDRPLYVFVVTNSTAPVEESQEKATANTFRMLAALGRDDTMPEIARTQEKEALEAQLKDDQRHHPEHIEADRARLKELETRVIQRKDFGPIKAVVCTLVCPDHGKHISIPETKAEQLAGIKARLQNVRKQTVRLDSYFLAQRRRTLSPDEKAQFAELNRQCAELHDQYDAVSELPNPPPELKSQPDGVPYKPIWTPVYVHSKTTILDDAVIIHGSANLNVRSMEVDSELNIVVPDYDAALSMRRDLWRIHAGEKGAVDDEAKAFSVWEKLIAKNKEQESYCLPPVASIIGFYDTQKTWETWD